MLDSLELKQAKILAVDDNPINLQVITTLLKKNGYSRVTQTSNPYEVNDLFNEVGFDLLLLDIHMPGMDGFQVMEQLNKNNPGRYLPILILTADISRDVRYKALCNGAKDFITKPFDKAEVEYRVRNILQVSLLQKMLQEQNDILEIKVRQRTKQLEEAQVKLVECLGLAAEYRDNETGMHVVRIGRMSRLLAQKMGLPQQQCDILGHASPMHDLGKIGITDEVLLKKGKLENKEWQQMQQHTTIGGDILRSVGGELMETAAIIAETHHEKWDGSGYPKGISGEEIPLITRITSVCDVFDALLSKRPYKHPWSLDKTITYLIESSGKHFDPSVVEAFITALPEIIVIREQFSDNNSQVEAEKITPIENSSLFNKQSVNYTHSDNMKDQPQPPMQ